MTKEAPREQPGEPTTTQLERRFTADMIKGFNKLANQHGYRASYFLQMVQQHGGAETARRLACGPKTSEGFQRLWQLNQLGLSAEAWMLHPEYERLFTAEQRELARDRLEKHEFDVISYLRSLD